MSNLVEFVDGDMTEEDRKKIDELLIKIDEENEQKVVNQLCQKQQYDFCEIDTYKMKGDLK